VWHRLHEVLLAKLHEADRIDWSRAAIDSSHVRAFGGREDRAEPGRPLKERLQAPSDRLWRRHAAGRLAHGWQPQRHHPDGPRATTADRIDQRDQFGDTLVNLLQTSEAPGLVAPATVANPDAGVRFQFTLAVDDVDAMVEELKGQGVDLLNGPMDRPWGIRTASFRDPGGHIWEVAH
jgi:catechol 2,3-dioxygenase-like lactoylglutathione lyase family enzyme